MRPPPSPSEASLQPPTGQDHLGALKRAFHDAVAQGDLDQAQEFMEAAIRLAPGAAALKALYASVLTRRGKHTEAAGELEAAARIEPGAVEYLAYAAASWDRACRPDKARMLVARLMKLDPLHPAGLALLV